LIKIPVQMKCKYSNSLVYNKSSCSDAHAQQGRQTQVAVK